MVFTNDLVLHIGKCWAFIQMCLFWTTFWFSELPHFLPQLHVFFWLGRLTTKDGSKWSLGGPGGDKASPNHGGWMIRGELLLGFQSNHLTSFDSSQRSLTQICWFNRKKVILLFVWKGGFLLDFEKSYSELKWKGRISNENVSSPQHWPSSKTSTTRVKIAVPQFFQDFDAGS